MTEYELYDWLHDVQCPICGMKASWQPSGNGYRTISCGHREMVEAIAARENAFNLHNGVR